MALKSVSPTNKNIITIKYVPLSVISELSNVLFQGNPKKHDIELLQLSIAENGFIDPPKWDDNLNNGAGGIVYGNGRLEALVKLLQERQRKELPPPDGIGVAKNGEWSIPIKFGVNAASELAAKKLAIDHNNLTNTGLTSEEQSQNYDEELYSRLLSELGEGQKPITIDEDYFQQIIEDAYSRSQSSSNEGEDTDLSEDDVKNIKPRVQIGEIWELGRHRLLVGDCTDSELLEKLLAGFTPQLIWSDPPYGIKCQLKHGKVGGGGLYRGKQIDSKQYPVISGDNTTDIAANSFGLFNKLYSNATQIWWGANHYCGSANLPDSPCWVVWDKKNGDNYFADCELAWTNFKLAVRKFDFTWNGFTKQGEAANEKRIHPNQKPVELIEWFWDKFCNESIYCFDPFLGSGSSIIAAEKHSSRTVYGCEIMPEYAEVIIQRWEQKTNQTAVKLT